MFLPQTTLPVTMTTNRNFSSYTSPKCFSTLWNHLPLPSPLKLLPASVLPASSGVWGIHFNRSPADERSETDHMINSDVCEITASFLLSLQALSIWKRATLSVTDLRNLKTEWSELLFTKMSEDWGAQLRPNCAATLSHVSSVWPPVEGGARWGTLSHLLGLATHEQRKQISLVSKQK